MYEENFNRTCPSRKRRFYKCCENYKSFIFWNHVYKRSMGCVQVFFKDISEYFNTKNTSTPSEYFNTKNTNTPQKKTFNGINLTYTITFGTKTIVLDRDDSPTTSLLDSDNDENSTYSKKRKLYTPAIVMQKTSFDGILKLSKCIDSCIKTNEKLLPLVSECNKNIIEDVCKKFSENIFLPEKDVFVKQYLTSHNEKIKNNIATLFNNKEFSEYYFDIVFYELISLHSKSIVKNVISKLTT